jgi:hypothetical protein
MNRNSKYQRRHSKSPLNISPAPELTMEVRAPRFMGNAVLKNIPVKTACYPINALARRFLR